MTRLAARIRAMFGNDVRFGAATVLFATVVWSSTGLFTRIIAHDAFTQLAWRGLFGALTALAVVVLTHGRRTLTVFRSLGWHGWIFSLLNTAGMLTFITALKLTTVAHVTTILATMPLVAALASWIWLRERTTWSTIVASVVAFAGVSLTVLAGLGEGALLGDILAMLMTALTVAALLVQRRAGPIDPVASAAVSAFVCMLIAAPLGSPFAVSREDIATLALFGLTNTGLGLTLFFVGARYIPATLSGLIGALDAPLSPLWVWLVFGEIPRATTILGGTVVVIAVMGHLAWSMRSAASRQQMGRMPG